MTTPEDAAIAAGGDPSVRLRRSPIEAFATGAAVGVLGGMIGLGGAEFRLPLLIGLFGFLALQAVILNKAMSLAVVITALPARLVAVPSADLTPHWPIVVNLLAGSLARRLGRRLMGHAHADRHLAQGPRRPARGDGRRPGFDTPRGQPEPQPPRARPGRPGLVAGFAIGVVASVMGVAGGELLIPTIVLLYGVDIKIAGSLSLAVSLPTMLVAFARYSRDQAFTVLADNGRFVMAMVVGSITGTLTGALLLGIIPNLILIPALALLLLLSAIKLWRHQS